MDDRSGDVTGFITGKKKMDPFAGRSWMIDYSLLIGKPGLPGLAIGKQAQAGNG